LGWKTAKWIAIEEPMETPTRKDGRRLMASMKQETSSAPSCEEKGREEGEREEAYQTDQSGSSVRVELARK